MRYTHTHIHKRNYCRSFVIYNKYEEYTHHVFCTMHWRDSGGPTCISALTCSCSVITVCLQTDSLTAVVSNAVGRITPSRKDKDTVMILTWDFYRPCVKKTQKKKRADVCNITGTTTALKHLTCLRSMP